MSTTSSNNSSNSNNENKDINNENENKNTKEKNRARTRTRAATRTTRRTTTETRNNNNAKNTAAITTSVNMFGSNRTDVRAACAIKAQLSSATTSSATTSSGWLDRRLVWLRQAAAAKAAMAAAAVAEPAEGVAVKATESKAEVDSDEGGLKEVDDDDDMEASARSCASDMMVPQPTSSSFMKVPRAPTSWRCPMFGRPASPVSLDCEFSAAASAPVQISSEALPGETASPSSASVMAQLAVLSNADLVDVVEAEMMRRLSGHGIIPRTQSAAPAAHSQHDPESSKQPPAASGASPKRARVETLTRGPEAPVARASAPPSRKNPQRNRGEPLKRLRAAM